MRKRVQIAVAVVVVALLGVVAWRGLRSYDHEPVYQGKGLRTWLWEYHWGYEGAATNAVRQIGTNAIPTLLEMLRKKDSPLMSQLINLWNSLHRHVWPLRWFPAWVRFPIWYRHQASIQHTDAAIGFSILGADAQQAVPDLVKIYHQTPSSQFHVREALSAIGPAAHSAIPLLLRDASNADQLIRIDAVITLGKIHAQPSVVVPVLARYLSDTDGFMRGNAAQGLGQFGTNARPTVPALLRLLADPETYVRDAATNALMKIDPEAAARAGVR